MSPATVIHIVLSIFFIDVLVDGLCSVYDVVDERFAQQVLVGAFGTVCNGYADTAYFAFVYVVGAEEQVIFAVFIEGCRGPHTLFGPFDLGGIDDTRMLFPVYQVFGGEGIQECIPSMYRRR